ncbi:hypothetical protein C272_12071 [Brevibacterium casei S18]|uniref:Uncharacterized protein n=1 Tax=Brevibacterium casei S18 TaxID=1229781 RepID=K9AG58_9MICO|nr:hypothetical protein C272_12071 [Brevibacterium casei S18]
MRRSISPSEALDLKEYGPPITRGRARVVTRRPGAGELDAHRGGDVRVLEDAHRRQVAQVRGVGFLERELRLGGGEGRREGFVVEVGLDRPDGEVEVFGGAHQPQPLERELSGGSGDVRPVPGEPVLAHRRTVEVDIAAAQGVLGNRVGVIDAIECTGDDSAVAVDEFCGGAIEGLLREQNGVGAVLLTREDVVELAVFDPIEVVHAPRLGRRRE